MTLELTNEEKETIINSLTYISQGMSLNDREAFNHLGEIVDKVKASIEPENTDD